jgi:hypothetical protein
LLQRQKRLIFLLFETTIILNGLLLRFFAVPTPWLLNLQQRRSVFDLVRTHPRILVLSLVSLFAAFYDRDPVDVALDWAPGLVPVIMPANDKRPGGDWEAGQFSPYS